MESKMLKDYKGFSIEKSYELDCERHVRSDTVMYSYGLDGNTIDCAPTLAGIKRKVDIYSK